MKMNNNRTAERTRTNVTATVIRETEKAFQAEVKYWTKFDAPVKIAKMWVPKSCCVAEAGTITSIDKFILDKWEEEHRKLISNHSPYAANKMRIEWDLTWKEELVKREKDEQTAYKKFCEDTEAKYLPVVKESSHKMLSEIGTIARAFGRIWNEKGFDAALCAEFIKWGEAVNKKYGELENIDEYYTRAKDFKKEDYCFILGFVYDVWVFGDFHIGYYDAEGQNFYKVKDNLERKYFKKEAALIAEYKDFLEKFYALGVRDAA